MTVAYVFDLDDTLLSTRAIFSNPYNRAALHHASNLESQNPSHKEAIHQRAYSSIIHKDVHLRYLLRSLRGPRYIFTNGTRMHARCALTALEIADMFDGQLDRDGTQGALKPSPEVYATMQRAISVHCRQCREVVFFDDMVCNLQTASRLGWRTVWINPAVSKAKYMPAGVDMGFSNIYDAIQHFAIHGKD